MVSMLVIIGGAQNRLHYTSLPFSIEECSQENINKSIFSNSTSALGNLPNSAESESFCLFDLSFNWYVTIGCLIVFLVAIPLSYILPAEKDYKLNIKLLSPVLHPFLNYNIVDMDELPELKTVKEF